MKLYYAPGACSLAPHIVLREGDFTFELTKVSLATGRTDAGEDYNSVNPNGYVPALKLDDGAVLTEAAVIVQYLADRKPDTELAPKLGSMERYRLMERLNFLSTEIHKQLAPFFNPKLPTEWRKNQLELLGRRFGFVEGILGEQPFLMGNRFTIADAYLFTILGWTKLFKIEMNDWPAIVEYMNSIADRPHVQAAMQAEGLVN
jgi:glutathione S-transferase